MLREKDVCFDLSGCGHCTSEASKGDTTYVTFLEGVERVCKESLCICPCVCQCVSL
jgi:hypothetical protein